MVLLRIYSILALVFMMIMVNFLAPVALLFLSFATALISNTTHPQCFNIKPTPYNFSPKSAII